MAIAAIAISFVTLSVGSGSRGDQLKADAEKLTGMIQLAVEEAVLTSRPIGLRFVQEYGDRTLETSYEWSYFEQGKWQVLLSHSFFFPQQIVNGTQLEMRLEGRAAELASGVPAKQPDNDDNDNTEERNKELEYKPDIFFLHSGEITPAFEIELRAESIAQQYQIAGNPVGQIRLFKRNDDNAEWL